MTSREDGRGEAVTFREVTRLALLAGLRLVIAPFRRVIERRVRRSAVEAGRRCGSVDTQACS